MDRLPDPGEQVQVLRMDGMEVGAARDPHRHDYHELIWIRSGGGRHLLDGEPLEVAERTITLIGRGQVHVFEEGCRLHGAIVRFGEELVVGGTPDWLLAGRGGRTAVVPEGEVGRLEALIDSLAAETARPPDAVSAALKRHLLSVLLLWIERWYDEARVERPDADHAEVALHRRFARLLERDFRHHHDAGHYADALGVPPAALSRALAQVTGRATKELVLDRVLLEAARLLRFTDLSAQEVAQRVGYGDPLYFSRAFKRRYGESPTAYREKSMHR